MGEPGGGGSPGHEGHPHPVPLLRTVAAATACPHGGQELTVY